MGCPGDVQLRKRRKNIHERNLMSASSMRSSAWWLLVLVHSYAYCYVNAFAAPVVVGVVENVWHRRRRHCEAALNERIAIRSLLQYDDNKAQNIKLRRSTTLWMDSTSRSIRTTTTTTTTETQESLPELFPALAESLEGLGFVTPTPIQAASAQRALLDQENLLLIAPTGSGKTLAYLLPSLSKALREDGTVLVVAPTRELAVQLMRDALAMLEPLVDTGDDDDDGGQSAVALAVRGVALPTSEELDRALILIGTPAELVEAFSSMDGSRGYSFLAGDTLSAIILDEVDVLLPLPPKTLRTSLDNDKNNKKKSNTPQDERRRQEQKRKLMSAKRMGVALNDDKQLVSPTEKLLNLVASCRFYGISGNGNDTRAPQLLAGSATASRRTLDRLNRAMRAAAEDASSTFELVWSKDVQACRPEPQEDARNQEGADHTIRSVTVPTEVKHQYISLSKEAASSADAVLAAVAKAANVMQPKTALVFLCGEFGKPNAKAPTNTAATQAKLKPKGATSKARRNSARLYQQKAAAVAAAATSKPFDTLSARKVCTALAKYGIEAQPLHVALGLELNAKPPEEDEDVIEAPPFLVTFEGSARGLHFDGVDVVFVVGRPSSAASYLHLAGRVGRSSANKQDGSVVIRPGTVVSLCTKGSATELEKWTRQIGGTALEELLL